jgi:hypothetical protein
VNPNPSPSRQPPPRRASKPKPKPKPPHQADLGSASPNHHVEISKQPNPTQAQPPNQPPPRRHFQPQTEAQARATTTPRSASPSHHRKPNQFCASTESRKIKEQRVKREQKTNEKKREKFSEEMRRERKKSEQIACGMVGSGAEKYWFFNFYKVYSSLSFLKGYCTLCKKI